MSLRQMKRTRAATIEMLPKRKTKASPVRSRLQSFVARIVEMGIMRITRSVPTLAKVEIVTLLMEWTAEQRCSPGGGDQFAETGVHQKAMRNMCSKKVEKVNRQATSMPMRERLPWREKML